MLNKSEILKKLIQEYDVKTTRDLQEMLKYLFAETIQEMDIETRELGLILERSI